MSLCRFTPISFAGITLLLSGFVLGQSNTLVDLDDFLPGDVRFSGFKLNNESTVEIEVSLLKPRRTDNDLLYTYAWILNADTRDLVWEAFRSEQVDREGENIILKKTLTLSPGIYEAYYSTCPYYDRWGEEYNNYHGIVSGLMNLLFDHDIDDRYFKEDFEGLYYRIHGPGQSLTADEVSDLQKALKDRSVLSLTPERDDMYNARQIKVKQSVKVRVYALGEARKDEAFDFGWITNVKTRERVWQFRYRQSEHAGGAYKNRLVDKEIELEPGDYEVVYVTDDSHSYHDWNMAAPFDPEFWGLTIWCVKPEEKNLVGTIDEAESEVWHNVVKYDKARDNDYFAGGFTLKKAMDVYISAMGEGKDDEMYDYAWIVMAGESHQKVWSMDYYDTEHAGGAEKNRLFDGVVHLAAGNYIVYYVTDDSHAYNSWNSAKPFDPEAWGVSVSVPADEYRDGTVGYYAEAEDPSILAKIVRVGDHARKQEKFSIDKDQYIHIYALGEGDRDEMYDFAWIENAYTGKIIWEMTYRKTENAGGARKNRMYDDRLLLPAGEYYVIYETDDSHAFGDWNDSPPYDQMNYGITISYAEQ
jgi:hypothetical protein